MSPNLLQPVFDRYMRTFRAYDDICPRMMINHEDVEITKKIIMRTPSSMADYIELLTFIPNFLVNVDLSGSVRLVAAPTVSNNIT